MEKELERINQKIKALTDLYFIETKGIKRLNLTFFGETEEIFKRALNKKVGNLALIEIFRLLIHRTYIKAQLESERL